MKVNLLGHVTLDGMTFAEHKFQQEKWIKGEFDVYQIT